MRPRRPLRILFVASTLGAGGAEMMLLRLLTRLPADEFMPLVMVLTGPSDLDDQVAALGVEVVHLHLTRRRLPRPSGAAALIDAASRFRPDLIQGWMYHGNLAATLAWGFCPGRPPLVWNIRQALPYLGQEPGLSRMVIKAGAVLSRFPAAVINNSARSRQDHHRVGYRPRRDVILPNGFDLDRFRPDPAARRDVRTELNLPPDALLIGHLGRWHPAKDYRNLISAVAQARSRRHGVRLVLAGRGLDPGNPALARLIDDHGLTQAVHRLGFRSDTPRLLAGLDLAVSSSAWEGFPNFIGEAMSCGVPPAATDAGDTAELVGDAGRVVPVRDARALAGAIDHLLAPPREERAALGRLARRRIRDHFELDRIAGRYQDLYHRLTRLRGRRMD